MPILNIYQLLLAQPPPAAPTGFPGNSYFLDAQGMGGSAGGLTGPGRPNIAPPSIFGPNPFQQNVTGPASNYSDTQLMFRGQPVTNPAQAFQMGQYSRLSPPVQPGPIGGPANFAVNQGGAAPPLAQAPLNLPAPQSSGFGNTLTNGASKGLGLLLAFQAGQMLAQTGFGVYDYLTNPNTQANLGQSIAQSGGGLSVGVSQTGPPPLAPAPPVTIGGFQVPVPQPQASYVSQANSSLLSGASAGIFGGQQLQQQNLQMLRQLPIGPSFGNPYLPGGGFLPPSQYNPNLGVGMSGGYLTPSGPFGVGMSGGYLTPSGGYAGGGINITPP